MSSPLYHEPTGGVSSQLTRKVSDCSSYLRHTAMKDDNER